MLVAGLVVMLLRGCVATTCYIPSGGMENSLYAGDRILVNRWSYGLRLPCMGWIGYHRWCPDLPQKDDILLFNNPGETAQPLISRRALFIGRCLGVAGDTLLVDSLFGMAPSRQQAPDQKFLYAYPPHQEPRLDSLLQRLGIRGTLLAADSGRHVRSFSRYERYLLQQALPDDRWLMALGVQESDTTLRPLVVPGKGKEIVVAPWNATLLCNTLVLHEHRRAEVRGDTLYLDGKPVRTCRFTQDYCWVGTNNPLNLSDSRLFGFVPHSHLVGRATCIWFSHMPDASLLHGYRWYRIGQKIH